MLLQKMLQFLLYKTDSQKKTSSATKYEMYDKIETPVGAICATKSFERAVSVVYSKIAHSVSRPEVWAFPFAYFVHVVFIFYLFCLTGLWVVEGTLDWIFVVETFFSWFLTKHPFRTPLSWTSAIKHKSHIIGYIPSFGSV